MRRAGWAEWTALELCSLLLSAVGVVLLIPLSLARAWRIKRVQPPGLTMRWVMVWKGGRLTWLWGNDEDGVVGPTWYAKRFKDVRIRAYLWSAWRNSASNFRWAAARPGGVFVKREWRGGDWYFQAGFRPGDGWIVLSGGKRKTPQI
jgi:hypothetical protein